jgi:hypothetical protein
MNATKYRSERFERGIPVEIDAAADNLVSERRNCRSAGAAFRAILTAT